MEKVTANNWLTCDAEAFLRAIDYGNKPLPADWLDAVQDEEAGEDRSERDANGWQKMARGEYRAKGRTRG